jgi:hypothetical protein
MMKHDSTKLNVPKEVITYAAGAIEARLAEIARNTQQSESELRQWVAIFLLSSWEGLSNSLPSLRGKTTKIYPSTRKMAMVNNSHPKSQKKPSDSSHPVGRKAPIAQKRNGVQKGFKYNGTHWMQKLENKARVKKLMKERRAKYHQKLAA